jgi:hypothetical protein
LFHVGANGFRTGWNYNLVWCGFGQRVDVTDFGRHDDNLLRRLAHELHHALSGTKLHHVRRSRSLRHLAHASAGATAFWMDDHRSIGIIPFLHFYMVRANTVVNVARAHHKPQPFQ